MGSDMSPEQPPALPPTDSQSSEQQPSYSHRRTGFVARKPKAVRDKINFMMLDGVPYRQILLNLGDDGKDLNEGHLTSVV